MRPLRNSLLLKKVNVLLLGKWSYGGAENGHESVPSTLPLLTFSRLPPFLLFLKMVREFIDYSLKTLHFMFTVYALLRIFHTKDV